MSGSFTFKQFTIHQQHAAMKVCTDSCLFGAWSAQFVSAGCTIMDIGAGTGLLSLMLAQQKATKIYAVEIDAAAVNDLETNIRQSKWKQQVEILHDDIRNVTLQQPIDFIICNPPFFIDSLKSPNNSINKARHDEADIINTLPALVEKFASDNGYFSVLLPYALSNQFISDMQIFSFSICKRIDVKQTEKHQFFRSMLLFKKGEVQNATADEITIKKNDKYTTTFIKLLQPYYLYL